MTQEIEIEAKSLVTKQDYLALLEEFNVTKTDAVIQDNFYFETPNFSLKDTGSSLRIRKKDSSYTLTLKQPHDIGLLETHQILTETESKRAIKEHLLPLGSVYDQLKSLHIPIEQIHYIGVLTTSRIERTYNNGIICFDKSHYLDQVDYEVEFEGSTEEHALMTLTNLLTELNLITKPPKNKIKRFCERKHELKHEK